MFRTLIKGFLIKLLIEKAKLNTDKQYKCYFFCLIFSFVSVLSLFQWQLCEEPKHQCTQWSSTIQQKSPFTNSNSKNHRKNHKFTAWEKHRVEGHRKCCWRRQFEQEQPSAETWDEEEDLGSSIVRWRRRKASAATWDEEEELGSSIVRWRRRNPGNQRWSSVTACSKS